MTKLTSWAGIVASAVALLGCDRASQLEEGVSTEVQVRQEFGDPVTITVLPDGSRVFDYPRQPAGWQNYVITIGPDGKMSSLRALLTEDNFNRITPGLQREQVLAILGRPAKTQRYDLKNEEVWEWRYKPTNESRLFMVTFGADGRVQSTARGDDPRETDGGGGR